MVQENIEDFEKVLRCSINPEKLLDEVILNEDIVSGVLKNHDALKGILFGFGRENAWNCQRNSQIHGFNRGPPLIPFRKGETTMPTFSFSSLEQELTVLRNRLQSFEQERVSGFNYMFLMLPSFAADPNHRETQKLKEKYYQTYLDILERIRNRSLLEVVLEKYCEDN